MPKPVVSQDQNICDFSEAEHKTTIPRYDDIIYIFRLMRIYPCIITRPSPRCLIGMKIIVEET